MYFYHGGALFLASLLCFPSTTTTVLPILFLNVSLCTTCQPMGCKLNGGGQRAYVSPLHVALIFRFDPKTPLSAAVWWTCAGGVVLLGRQTGNIITRQR